VSGPDHDGIDRLARDRARGDQPRQRVEDAGGDVRRGRSLDGPGHSSILDQDRIRISAADVDADASHQAKTGW
jgi:hypothetical protein